jgi:AcrR family transcriptional regulator
MSRNSPPPARKPARGTARQSFDWPAVKKKVPFSSAKKKIDRRVRATRDGLGDALIALMHEKPFETITVQHVLDRAKVSRSTFYSHYSDKNDLFLSDVEDFFEMFSTALIRNNDTSNRVAPVQEFFAHVADMRQFISSMTASQKVRDVFDLGQGHFARAIEQRLATLPATRALSPTRRSALAHASAGSLFSLLNWWLAHGNAATPAQMDALFHQTLWAGINPVPAPRPASMPTVASKSVVPATRKPR